MSQSFKYTHAILIYPLSLVLALWLVYWFEIKFNYDFTDFGIYPLTTKGLRGIVFSPFIHSSMSHLINNSVPLLLLTMALIYFYRDTSKKVILYGILLSGVITWIIGRPSYHIGASGLVYVLASFLFFKGIFSKYYRLVALSLIVVFVYGSLVWGLFPGKSGVSWEGHLAGFLVGLFLAFVYKSDQTIKQKYEWEKVGYDETDDEFMKQFDENGNFCPTSDDNDFIGNEDINITYHFKQKNSEDLSD